MGRSMARSDVAPMRRLITDDDGQRATDGLSGAASVYTRSIPPLMARDSTADDPFRPLAFIRLALWFGLWTGIAEVMLLAVKKLYLRHLIKIGSDVVWMAPLADSVLFLAVGIIFGVIARSRRGAGVFRAATTVFVFLSVLSVALYESRLAWYARELIAIGVAVQAARLLTPRVNGFYRLVRRTLPWTVVLVLLLPVELAGSRWFGYQRTVATLPPSVVGAPNVLLVVLDTVRARNLSVYGYHRPTTPTLEQWAQTAVVFERAIAPSPWTFPSHASLFTGRWPHELSANWQTPLDTRHPMLAEVVRDRGYVTAGFAANTFYATAEFGMARGFLHYEDYAVTASQFLVSTAIGRALFSFSLDRDVAYRVREFVGYREIPGRRNAAAINRSFLTWLDRQTSSRPFFVFLNYLDAHQPFLPPAPFNTKFTGTAPRGNPTHTWDREWSAADIQAETDAYDGAIAYLDDQLARLASELQRRNVLDNTIIVVTSDHGEHLGEHGFMRHGNTLYTEALHVPLIIRWPRQMKTGLTVREPVSLRDIPATVLALLGMTCDGCVPGTPLLDRVSVRDPGSASPILSEVSRGIRIPDRYPNARSDLKSLIVGDRHYIVNTHGSEELYDLAADPAEQRNLARDQPAVVEEFRRQVLAVSLPRN